ncbi:glycosyltransferase family 4 protein [Sediminicola luteus]|uniref:Glycosyl transferase family 1 domain-containing protein n=1 Tax=Sediminicola luteus TaxID=319238 RepID=A0A2A4G3R0_9FLAO|nr:glycosyltransferase [Sediminicola luteus]PCE62600.1 hypothetical protein B7P33_18380 [Sediminicola luteus]
MKENKVLHITNIASLYRKSQWAKLVAHPTMDYHFVFGENPFSGIKVINVEAPPFSDHSSKIHSVTNFWVKQKYLIWQSGVIKKCLTTNASLVILLGEFNVLSNWIATVICRFRGIRVVYRGHGMYGNEKGLKYWLRKINYKMASAHLVYERRGKSILVSEGFNKDDIHIIFNSLDYEVHKKDRPRLQHLNKMDTYPFFDNPGLPTLIFIGRLTPVKKLHLLLEAKSALDSEKWACNLLIVGDGPMKLELESYARENLKPGSFHFYGACYDDETNSALLACADACVSPGNVGLTAIHSLSYGTPVITHGNFENQMPEVEAITENKTGLFFEENNSHDMALKIKHWLNMAPKDRNVTREHCYQIIDRYYNPDYQVKVLENLVCGKKPLV